MFNVGERLFTFHPNNPHEVMEVEVAACHAPLGGRRFYSVFPTAPVMPGRRKFVAWENTLFATHENALRGLIASMEREANALLALAATLRQQLPPCPRP